MCGPIFYSKIRKNMEKLIERRSKYLAAKKHYEENKTSIKKAAEKFGIDRHQFSIYLEKGFSFI